MVACFIGCAAVVKICVCVCARGDFLPRDQSHPAFVTLPHQLKVEAANTGWVVGDESRCPPLSLGLVPDQKAWGAAL